MVGQNKNIIDYIQQLGETSLTNKLQDISKTQYPSPRSFQGTRSEDRIICKIEIVLSTTTHAICNKSNLQHVQFVTHAIYNMCNLQQMQFLTHAICNTYEDICKLPNSSVNSNITDEVSSFICIDGEGNNLYKKIM